MSAVSAVLGARLKRYYNQSVTVSTWTDDNGVANATQGTAARQFTITTTPVGKKAVQSTPDNSFGTNADVMSAAATGASSTPNYTLVACMFKLPAGYVNDGSGASIVLDVEAAGASRASLAVVNADNKLYVIALGNNLLANTTATVNDGKWHTAIGQVDNAGTTATLWLDGVSQNALTPASDGLAVDLSTATVNLGASNGGPGSWNGFFSNPLVAQDTSSFSSDVASLHTALLQDAMVSQLAGTGPAVSFRAAVLFSTETAK